MSKMLVDLAVDSNAAIAYVRGDSAAIAWVESASALFLPVICLGELRFGALHSKRVEENLARIQPLVDLCAIVDVTRRSAEQYGELRQRLAKQGTPIPDADMWIAAVCLEHGLPLLSEDAHFRHVPGLACHDWTSPPGA